MTDQSAVLFVCPHGAAKSRMAAAFFNHIAGPGWRGVSAGTEPQENVSVHVTRLLSGTAFEPLVDLDPPRHISEVTDAVLVVAIDCPAADPPGAIRWELANQEFNTAMRDEILARVEALARQLSSPEQPSPDEPGSDEQ